MSVDTEIVLDEKISLDVKEPKKYKVLFLNDNGTPMEFVIDVLQKIYKHTFETASDITMKIHNEGSGIVGVYSYEIAEMKAAETINLARNQGFPLNVKIEEE